MNKTPSLYDMHPFAPSYFMAAVRNLITMSPGLIAVLVLLSILRRKRRMFKQYKLTVVFLTFGGFSLAIPILSFNLFMVFVIPQKPEFLISTVACSLIKQFCAATMNSTFSISCAIALLRYALVLHGKELKFGHLVFFYFAISGPLYIYFVLAFFVGTIRKNDECPYFIEIEWYLRPVFYFGYLALVIIVTDYCNIRVLAFLVAHRRKLRGHGISANEQFSRKDRDQFHLAVGLLVQSFTVTCTFGSTILFMLLFSYGIAVPDWLSTITNTLSSISTLLNPFSAAIFIRPFRREMLRSIVCSKALTTEIMGPETMPTTLTVVRMKTTISAT